MKRFLMLVFLVILALPLVSFAGNDKKGTSLFQELKQAGKEVKESAKDVGKEVKKDAKQTGKDLKEAGKEAKKNLKGTGKEAKKSGKGLASSFKHALKSTGKSMSDAWHGLLDFLGFSKGDKKMKKDNTSGQVNFDTARIA